MPPVLLTKESLADTTPSGPTPEQRAVAGKLLAVDGKTVVWQEPDQHAHLLATRGRLWPGPVVRVEGEPCHCHTNAADLWGRDVEGTQLVTGYALSGGVWVQHSWVVADEAIFETTLRRKRYFGVALDKAEATAFFCGNVLAAHWPDVASLMASFGTEHLAPELGPEAPKPPADVAAHSI
jgi:hypothetical protein